MKKLREALDKKGFVRIMEAHNGISALAAQAATFDSGSEVVEYDALW